MFRKSANLGLFALVALFPCQDKLYQWLHDVNNYFHYLWGRS